MRPLQDEIGKRIRKRLRPMPLPIVLLTSVLAGCQSYRTNVVNSHATDASKLIAAEGLNPGGSDTDSPNSFDVAAPKATSERNYVAVAAQARVVPRDVAVRIPQPAGAQPRSAPSDVVVRIPQVDSDVKRVSTTNAPPAPNPSQGMVATLDPVIPLPAATYPIDLTTSLRLADSENPVIAEARVAILSALAVQTQARALLIPTLNGGMNYHGHNGDLQRSSGRILRLSEQSFYIGAGARTLAAESNAIPGVTIFTPLTDALFEPLAARQRVTAAQYDASATANSVLLEVSELFFELIRAEASLEAWRKSAGEAQSIVRSVKDYAETGQGRRADSDRADTELRLLEAKIQAAEGQVAVASARLCQRLNLDANVRLQGITGPLEPIQLIDQTSSVESLLATALQRRPELVARAASISEAEYRVRQEKTRPLLPTFFFGFSGGAFGGGSNLVPPYMAHFGGRTDTDVRAVWTLLNFGMGNASLINRRKAEVGQAMAERSRAINRVRQEVTASKAKAEAFRQQVEVARAELKSAEDGLREDMLRLRETISLPVEVIDSLTLLANARQNLIAAIVRSNQAQLALFVSLGSPPPLDPSSAPPATAPPVATPLQSPITMPAPEPMPKPEPIGPPTVGQ